MAFSVANFKSQTQATRDFARPNTYSVIVSPPGQGAGAGRILEMITESLTLPGMSFTSVDNYKPYGDGIVYNIPYNYNPQEISCTHLVDGALLVNNIFYEWSNMITDTIEEDKFTAKYHDDYVTTLQVNVYDQQGTIRQTWEMYEAYPISIDQTQLSWATTDDILRLNVTYRYSHFKIL